MLQLKMSRNVAAAPTATTLHTKVTVYRPGMHVSTFAASKVSEIHVFQF